MKNKRTWRLIVSSKKNAAENMAIDESLLKNFKPDKSYPVFRVYAWKTPSFSIGRYQKVDNVLKVNECKKKDVPIVRRITGGGSILHDNELTYSMVIPKKYFSNFNDIKESYKRLNEFLIRAYKKMGLKPEYAADSKKPGIKFDRCGNQPVCFAGTEKYDILINGKKIGGNAQKRTKYTIFQHGSIPIKLDTGFINSLLKKKLFIEPGNITSISDFIGNINFKNFRKYIIASFQMNLKITFSESRLTKSEKMAAEELLETKYLNDKWNLKGIT